MVQNKIISLKKEEILEALEIRKEKDQFLMKYKAEYQNNQLINDLIQYIDEYIKYLKVYKINY